MWLLDKPKTRKPDSDVAEGRLRKGQKNEAGFFVTPFH
jgi:hypothetical protein